MMFWMIGAGLGILAVLFRLAALARLTIPLLYTVSMLTVFPRLVSGAHCTGGQYPVRAGRSGRSVLAAFLVGTGLELHSREAGRPRRR